MDGGVTPPAGGALRVNSLEPLPSPLASATSHDTLLCQPVADESAFPESESGTATGKRPMSATFKVPMSPSKRPVAIKRPPLLVVDTTALEEVTSPALPRTPANVRMNNPTELHNAVCAGNVAAAQALLEEGHEVDPIEEHGFSPLHKASAFDKDEKRLALIQLLLRHSADVLRGDLEGYTPLHWAAALGHTNVLIALLDAGASVSQRSELGETALHRASRYGRVEAASLLVGAHGDAKAVFARNHEFQTPLDVAGVPLKRVNRAHRTAIRRILLEVRLPSSAIERHRASISPGAPVAPSPSPPRSPARPRGASPRPPAWRAAPPAAPRS